MKFRRSDWKCLNFDVSWIETLSKNVAFIYFLEREDVRYRPWIMSPGRKHRLKRPFRGGGALLLGVRERASLEWVPVRSSHFTLVLLMSGVGWAPWLAGDFSGEVGELLATVHELRGRRGSDSARRESGRNGALVLAQIFNLVRIEALVEDIRFDSSGVEIGLLKRALKERRTNVKWQDK